MTSPKQSRASCAAGMVVVGLAALMSVLSGQGRLPADREDAAMRVREDAQGQLRVFVKTGDSKTAKSYYERISGQGELNWDVGASSCQSLLHEFLGYDGLGCEGLEEASPAELSHAFPGQVEAVRFFAPKVSTVGPGTPPTEIGWRKLIRLRARTSSRASAAGVAAAFVLFNYLVQPPDSLYPAAPETVNTQVMLVRATASPNNYWGYWVLYDAFGQLTDHLNATFEDGSVAAQGKKFFVPTACIECHGRDEKTVYLSLLDVDHWLERTRAPEEFASVKAPLPDLIGPLMSSSVMVTLRNLNVEIAAQNAAAGAPPHVREASANWVRSHPSTQIRELEIYERSFVRAPGDAAWSSTEDDVALLRLLNRYCYRCHGTKRYNVFERAWVVKDKNNMIKAIEESRMPEDRNRTIPEPARSELIRLLRQLR